MRHPSYIKVYQNHWKSFLIAVVGKDSDERYDFERQKRKLFSKLSGTNHHTEDDDDEEDRNQGGGGVHSELEALRSSGESFLLNLNYHKD